VYLVLLSSWGQEILTRIVKQGGKTILSLGVRFRVSLWVKVRIRVRGRFRARVTGYGLGLVSRLGLG
jgi:hypothetical protein